MMAGSGRACQLGPNPGWLGVGGADGIRTHDLLDAIEARFQLRHGPTACVFHSGLQVQPAPVPIL